MHSRRRSLHNGALRLLQLPEVSEEAADAALFR